MCNSYFKIKTYCFLAFAACCILSASPAVAQTYFNDFEGVPGPEWSNGSTDITPAGARTFLGQFGNQTVSLTLASVPAGNVTVSFELFIIQSWDGHKDSGGYGPDVWDLSVGGGPTLLNTTFATHDPRKQAYPDTYPGGLDLLPFYPHNTGAAEVDTLGYSYDAVYNLSFTFAHAGGDLVLNFSATGLQGLGDESWGLDNVLVIPEIEVPVDIKPGSCPNPLNVKAKGVLPAAILGTEDFDVTQIDPASVRLVGVLPLRWALEDVATPFEGDKDDCGDCMEEGPDGYLDLTLKFEMQEIVAALGDVEDGDCEVLTLKGETVDGTHIVGKDVVVILKKGKGKK